MLYNRTRSAFGSLAFTGLGFQQCVNSGTDSDRAKVALYEEQGAWKRAAVPPPNRVGVVLW